MNFFAQLRNNMNFYAQFRNNMNFYAQFRNNMNFYAVFRNIMNLDPSNPHPQFSTEIICGSVAAYFQPEQLTKQSFTPKITHPN